MSGLSSLQGFTSNSQPAAPSPISPRTHRRQGEILKAVDIGSTLYDVTAQVSTFLKYTGKSGLTPIRLSGDEIADPIVRDRVWKVESHQRGTTFGFTAEELYRLGALAALDERPMSSDLQNALHPVFVRQRWQTEGSMPKHVGATPILGDDDGFWLVGEVLFLHLKRHH